MESLRAKVKDLEVIVEKTLKDRERIGVLEKKLESDAAEIANLKETFRALEAEYAKKVEGLRLECERASKIIEEERAFYKAYSNRHTVRPNGDTAPTSELSNPTGELKEEILDLSCSLKEKIRNMEQGLSCCLPPL